jgi:DNA repair protein RadD
MELRPYQNEALCVLLDRLKRKREALLQAATGAGKTIMFAELIRLHMNSFPGMRIGILAHREELIAQAAEKLLKVWPAGAGDVGLACASMGAERLGRAVTVCSVQTLASRELPSPFDLLVIDECHHIPSVETGGQYHEIIERSMRLNPALRVLGVTATPFRLGHGYIYGDERKPGHTNFFTDLDYSITLNDLIAQGYLCPWRAKEPVSISGELARVKTSMGEYSLRGLSELLSKQVHIKSAVDAYERYGEGRERAIVFAVTIEHAKLLAEAFRGAGHKAAALHSGLGNDERRAILGMFERGELRFVVNVGILTEGWDSPRLDLIMMCRPTKSAGLFVQMVGRGTRAAEGKKDLLVLDLAGNFAAHGDPSAPRVWTPKGAQGDPPLKPCPECAELVFLAAMACPECGHEFPKPRREEPEKSPELVERAKEPPKPVTVIRKPAHDGPYKVVGYVFREHVSKRGNLMAVMEVTLQSCESSVTLQVYLDFEGQGSAYGQKKARAIWQRFGKGKPPATVREAISRSPEFRMPESVMICRQSDGWTKIEEFQKARAAW